MAKLVLRQGGRMYKTTSKFMQAGKGRDVPRKKPITRHHKARATIDELREFGASTMMRDILLNKLRPVVNRLRSNAKLRPGQLAKLLNAEGCTTAQGRIWTERRVILLLRLFAEQSARRASRKIATPKPMKASEKPPLSNEEMARRLSALGRVKGSEP